MGHTKKKMNTREYYKQRGICPRCKKAPAFGGFVHCAECLEIISLNNMKYRTPEKNEEYEKRNNEKKRLRYSERKKEGLCTSCGKKPKQHGMLCAECWVKRQNTRKAREYPNRSRAGEHFRSRIAAGVCMYCRNDVVSGYKLCEKCLEKRRRNTKKAADSSPWRKEETARWEYAKRKHLENG